ncbi:hypothetical protein SS50377_27934 [Spironucleus salmonicida]|uniref:Nuclear transport factor 2 n=1 Tax=Spironucleus salmonicida TaxID=348837 RepID=V6LFL2_9EUKA|nr:hypothetical protein SS50377_27934 [Spironucleus salmonicida]|eukprot:EST42496.1 hypothetical protein SS50377_17802 [Spironucleus salmonicida]
MAPLTSMQIAESFLYNFYESTLTDLPCLNQLFVSDATIQFSTPISEKKQYKVTNFDDISVGMSQFLLKYCKKIDVLQWSQQCVGDGIVIKSIVQYKDIRDDVVVLTSESFYLIQLPIQGAYAVKGYICQLMK